MQIGPGGDGGGSNFDWVGFGATAAAIAGAVYTGARAYLRERKAKEEPPRVPLPAGPVPIEKLGDEETDRVIERLNDLITKQASENERLWGRINEQDTRYGVLETRYGVLNDRCTSAENALEDIRNRMSKLRARMIAAGIDPG